MIALFDLDGTIINSLSLVSFYEYYLRYSEKYVEKDAEIINFYDAITNKRQSETSRMEQNAWFYRTFIKDMSISELSHYSNQWFQQCLSSDIFFNDQILKEVELRRKEGYQLIIMTGSFYEVVKPIADYIGITTILSAPLEQIDGIYTGNLIDTPTIATGKVKAIRKYLTNHSATLDCSYGYGDDVTDLDFLEIVSHPVVFNGDELKAEAIRRKWKVITPIISSQNG